MTWTLAALDRVIAQAKANHRSAAYVGALERRRAALVAGVEEAEQRKAAAEAASPTVDAWLEMSTTVLEAAPGVGSEDANAIGRMLDCLATWFPLVPEDGEGEDGGEGPRVPWPQPGIEPFPPDDGA